MKLRGVIRIKCPQCLMDANLQLTLDKKAYNLNHHHDSANTPCQIINKKYTITEGKLLGALTGDL
jgi:hypothetical protein